MVYNLGRQTYSFLCIWYARVELNHRHPAYKTGALTPELLAYMQGLVYRAKDIDKCISFLGSEDAFQYIY